MEFIYFLKGLAIGFSLAAPVGPVGILCVRRTLADGEAHGFMTGLSAAASDMVYGFIAVFGITLISDFITEQQNWIRIIGGIFLLALGVHSYRSRRTNGASANSKNGHTLSFISTFFLTLTNPLTLFACAAVFASIGIEKIAGNRLLAVAAVAGVFVGSFLWFSLLIGFARIFKEKISSSGLSVINKISGSLLLIIGVYALLSGISGVV